MKAIKTPLLTRRWGFLIQGTRNVLDDKDYELDGLSDEAKSQLANIQFVDAELQKLNAQTAVLQTARMAYAKALNEALVVSQTIN